MQKTRYILIKVGIAFPWKENRTKDVELTYKKESEYFKIQKQLKPFKTKSSNKATNHASASISYLDLKVIS